MNTDPRALYLAALPADEGDVFVVPNLYQGELAFAPLTIQLVKHAQAIGVPLKVPPGARNVPSTELRDETWYLPAMFVVAQSPAIRDGSLAVALNLVSSYLYDRLRTLLPTKRPDATINLFVRKGDESFEFHFHGPAEALRDLQVADVVAALKKTAHRAPPQVGPPKAGARSLRDGGTSKQGPSKKSSPKTKRRS